MRYYFYRQKLLIVTVLAASLWGLAPPSALADTSCPVPANRPTKDSKQKDESNGKAEPPSTPQITLKPESSSEVINFGGTRGTKSVDVVLLASRPLPDTFSTKQLELDSPKRFQRTGQALDSASLRLPRFSNPQIIEHRKKIRVRICIDTSEAQAGTYSGPIYISGPPGIGSASVTVTANVKTSEFIFWLILIGAVVIAFFLLLFKTVKEEKEKLEEQEKAKEEERQNKAKAEGKTARKKPKLEFSWWGAARLRVKDPLFLISTIIALVAAFVAMRAIYDSTPAWGTETWTNIFALFGTAFGAAGVGSLITAFAPKSS